MLRGVLRGTQTQETPLRPCSLLPDRGLTHAPRPTHGECLAHSHSETPSEGSSVCCLLEDHLGSGSRQRDWNEASRRPYCHLHGCATPFPENILRDGEWSFPPHAWIRLAFQGTSGFFSIFCEAIDIELRPRACPQFSAQRGRMRLEETERVHPLQLRGSWLFSWPT